VRLLSVGFKVEVEADVFRKFGVEMGLDSGINLAGNRGDAFGGGVFVFVVGGDESEGNDVADFAFNTSAVAVFLGSGASVDSGSALILTESFADGAVAAAEDPVDDFAFAHDEEVVLAEVAAVDHGLKDVSGKLNDEARFVTVIDLELRKGGLDEVDTSVGVSETKFVKAAFVLEDGEAIIVAFNLVKSEGAEEEKAVGESIFKAVGGEARGFVVSNRIEVIVGDFASEDAVFFELAGDDARITDELSGVLFE